MSFCFLSKLQGCRPWGYPQILADQLTLGAVHKRRRKFFGSFLYPPPPGHVGILTLIYLTSTFSSNVLQHRNLRSPSPPP